jgi:hypothetical protein
MEDKKKKTKKQIKVQDMKPSKDAKGGVSTDTHQQNVHQLNVHQRTAVQRPGSGDS